MTSFTTPQFEVLTVILWGEGTDDQSCGLTGKWHKNRVFAVKYCTSENFLLITVFKAYPKCTFLVQIQEW